MPQLSQPLSSIFHLPSPFHIAITMAPYSLLAAALVASSATALQIPIHSPPTSWEQAPVVVSTSASDVKTNKTTIDTDALQALIKPDNLMSRAKELYGIAKLGEEQYGHPTRVIGSTGKPPLNPTSKSHSSLRPHADRTVTQDIPARLNTYRRPSKTWAPTTHCRPRTLQP